MRHTMPLEFLPRDGVRLSALAAHLGMTKQAVGEVVDDLEAAKYIRRIGAPNDRRAKLVILSAKGEAAYRDAFVILDEMEGEFEAAVGQTQYRQVKETMNRLTNLLNENAATEAPPVERASNGSAHNPTKD